MQVCLFLVSQVCFLFFLFGYKACMHTRQTHAIYTYTHTHTHMLHTQTQTEWIDMDMETELLLNNSYETVKRILMRNRWVAMRQ